MTVPRKWQKIDFTDVARHGGRVVRGGVNIAMWPAPPNDHYIDGDEVGPLQFRFSPYRSGSYPTIGVDGGGIKELVLYSPQYDTLGVYYKNAALVGKNILPAAYHVEAVVRDVPGAGNFFNSLAAIAVANSDFENYRYQIAATTPSPFIATVGFEVVSGSNYWRPYFRALSGTLTNAPGVVEVIPVSPDTGVYIVTLTKRLTGIVACYFDSTGSYIRGAYQTKANTYEFDKSNRLVLGCHNAMPSQILWTRIRTLLLTEYSETDLMNEASAVVSAISPGATIVGGGGDAKTAIHDDSEASYIVLHPEESIEIDLTSTTKDAPIHEIQVTANSTDTNFLSIKLATNAMLPSYSSSVELGDNSSASLHYRCLGEKKTGFTNTIKHVFYPEIRKLCGLAVTETEGCRKFIIENTKLVNLTIYEINVLQSMQELALGDEQGYVSPGTDVVFDFEFPSGDVPIDGTGPSHTIWIANTSEGATSSIKVKMVSDGYVGVDAVLEYSADSIDWYDKIITPLDPDGVTLIDVGHPQGMLPLYIRTKLPYSGQLFQRFVASFQTKLVNT